jgi:hypothetical protein
LHTAGCSEKEHTPSWYSSPQIAAEEEDHLQRRRRIGKKVATCFRIYEDALGQQAWKRADFAPGIAGR